MRSPSLIRISSEEPSKFCCSDPDPTILSCKRAKINPGLLNSERKNVSILDIEFTFDFRVEPHGFAYHNSQGEEAVITYNNKTGNMFGSFTDTEGKSYAIQKCHHEYVIKQYGVTDEIVSFSIKFYYTKEVENSTTDLEGELDQIIGH